ncbi:MAG: hypothetical protein J0L87_14420 [Bacteroidetes bacterium]|nr:hypothetical protein [Bacteroidota bacterium]
MKATPYLLFFILLIVSCTINQKAQYIFPNAMPEYVQKAYTEQCDKGQILYNLNCAKCHSKKVKNRILIPDFKAEQLKGYELRVTNMKHEDQLQDTVVTEEELGLIMTFLKYKERSGLEFKP